MADKPTKFLQEDVTAILVWDTNNSKLVRGLVSIELFDEPYRTVVEKCISYIDRYNEPPKDLIATELESYLIDSNTGPRYQDLLKALYYLKDSPNNPTYIISKLTDFVRDRTFEKAFYKAAPLIQAHKIDEAQEVIDAAKATQLTLFDPGIKITDLSLLQETLEDTDIFMTGVPTLDHMGVGPARGELYIFMALMNKGKSWSLLQIGKLAALANRKVAHVTLELSAKQTQKRYIQSLLGITAWQYDHIAAPMLVIDGNDKIIRLDYSNINVKSLEDPDIIDYISERFNKFGSRLNNIWIKEFPSATLTLPALEAYLDGLEQTQGFVPDILILDHLTHMRLPTDDFRLKVGRLVLEVRGLAGKRNMAIASAHQSNRVGMTAKELRIEHTSEDLSVFMTADVGVLMSQSKMEEQSRLARLTVARNRSQRSGFTVIITMGIATGNLCLDSHLLDSDYDPRAAFSGEISMDYNEMGEE